ncbi:hypothetical protein D9M71_686210 [compost metagenome]
MAAPPACSTRNDIGLASYIRRSLPAFPGSRLSHGYMNTPPRVRMRCTSATIEAIQRMLKFLPRGPSSPARHSSMYLRTGGAQWRMFDMLMANSLVSSGIIRLDWVSTKLPASRSSVNTCTPLPTVSTSVVCGP